MSSPIGGSLTDAARAGLLDNVWRRDLRLAPLTKTRIALRVVTAVGQGRVHSIEGLERLAPDKDPFVLVLNHSQRLEGFLIAAFLACARRGRLIHFVVDWTPMLIPGVGFLYRAAEVIRVPTKRARPAILDRLRPLLCSGRPAYEDALRRLRAGSSVGIFPEGKMNRSRLSLAPGHGGAVRLAIASGAPLIPAGIRYAPGDGTPISDWESFRLRIGEPIRFAQQDRPQRESVRSGTHRMMAAIAALSGKTAAASASAGNELR